MQRILGVIVLLLLSSAQYTVVNALSQTVIRVCRNKHCCKRNPHLLQTIYQLETQAKIESSGCLSHCDNGPNVEIENSSSSTILNGVVDATTAAVLIEQAIDGAPIPKLLTAASKLMERVHSRQGMLIFYAIQKSRLQFIESPFRKYSVSRMVLFVAKSNVKGRAAGESFVLYRLELLDLRHFLLSQKILVY
jgi:(2Fe-2S) ferredoxin